MNVNTVTDTATVPAVWTAGAVANLVAIDQEEHRLHNRCRRNATRRMRKLPRWASKGVRAAKQERQ